MKEVTLHTLLNLDTCADVHGGIISCRFGLDYWADVVRGTEVDNQWSTALHLAASNGHVSIAKELLHHVLMHVGCSIKKGRTPLHLAAMKINGIIDEIISVDSSLSWFSTHKAESILHLCIMFAALRLLHEGQHDSASCRL